MVRVKVTADLREINSLVVLVRKDFKRTAPRIIKKEIKRDIQSGVSPVRGKGRFEKYSKSYKEAIKGETAFRRTKSGKVFAITTKGVKGSRAFKQGIKDKIFDLNEDFRKFKKKLAPINMTFSGKMIKSLFIRVRGITRRFSMLIAFGDDVADFHNKKGAGGKTVRRLLPTESGEKFNSRLENIIRNLLNKSVSTIVKRFK